jgi:acetyl esterase/lipase
MVPNEKSEQPRAVIVWIHGGGWTSPDLTKKYRPTRAIIDACKAGFVCTSIEYRLVTEKAFPAPIEDCKCAIRFLKAHSEELGIDPERIGVWGESAGGQLAALVGASYHNPRIEGTGGWNDYTSEVKAVCDWYFGGDMTFMCSELSPAVLDRAKELGIKLSSRDPEKLFGADSEEQSNARMKVFFGKPGKDASEISMDISPIFYVDQRQPAYLLMHGDSDRLVPIEYSYNYYDALLSHGHDVTFIIIPEQGHGFFKGQGYYDIVINFFKKHLG